LSWTSPGKEAAGANVVGGGGAGDGAAAPGVSPPAPSPFARLGAFGALLEALRPRQWPKNLLVFAGLLFTLFDRPHPPADWWRTGLAFAVFCLLSGCVYLVNDAVDFAADRAHPRKRFRPIASGRLSRRAAVLFAVCAAPAALALSYAAVGGRFALVAAVYFVLTLAYTLRLKHEVIVDVMIVAAGFVLRAVAGAQVVAVPSSQWLIACTGLLALFIAVAKRRAEFVSAAGSAAGVTTRPILEHYSLPLLDQMLTVVATSSLVAYFLYTIESDTGRRHPLLIATAPFVLYGLLRYLHLMHREGKGEAPEEVLLTDRPMQLNLLLWVAAVVLALARS
jgi:4-hydroxybenzoate polyprenyltransferase